MTEISPREAKARPDPLRWRALALLCGAFFLVTVDASVVLVALPSIGSALHFAESDLQWVMSSYMLSFGGLLLLGGRIGDLFGQRRVFLVGLTLFALASLAAGLATGPGMLIVARVGQGASGAVMTPAALALLMAMFEEGAERNKALAVWASTGGIGGAAAWLIGGVITDGLGWEWIFYLNLPIAAGALALSPLLLPKAHDEVVDRHFDVAGALTVTGSLVALVYGVVQAPAVGWLDAQTLILGALTIGLALLFIVVESRSAAPLVPLGVFRSRALVGGNLLLIATGALAFGGPFVLSRYGQEVLGWSAGQFGLAFVIAPVLVAVGSSAGQSFATRGNGRIVTTIGMALMATGLVVFTQLPVDGHYAQNVLPGLVPFGLGIGFGYVAGSISSLSGIPAEQTGLASGLSNASFQIGGALGVAIMSTAAASNLSSSTSQYALTASFHSSFAVAIGFAVLGAVVAMLVSPRPESSSASGPSPEPTG